MGLLTKMCCKYSERVVTIEADHFSYSMPSFISYIQRKAKPSIWMCDQRIQNSTFFIETLSLSQWNHRQWSGSSFDAPPNQTCRKWKERPKCNQYCCLSSIFSELIPSSVLHAPCLHVWSHMDNATHLHSAWCCIPIRHSVCVDESTRLQLSFVSWVGMCPFYQNLRVDHMYSSVLPLLPGLMAHMALPNTGRIQLSWTFLWAETMQHSTSILILVLPTIRGGADNFLWNMDYTAFDLNHWSAWRDLLSYN